MYVLKKVIPSFLKFVLFGSLLTSMFLFLAHGWECYATFTDRGGIYRHAYYSRGFTKNEFLMQLFLILCIVIVFLFFQIKNLIHFKKKEMIILTFSFLIFLILLFFYETYLDSLYVPKG